MEVAREQPGDAVVRTDTGLLVPGHALRDANVESKPGSLVPSIRQAMAARPMATAYDPDGRRRVGMTKAERKTVQAAIDILGEQGIGVLLACGGRFDGKDPCGGWLTPEGAGATRGGGGDGFGCSCTRVHFLGV